MGLFDKLFQGNKIEIASPVNGQIVPISHVSDPTFSEEMVGKGVAIIPSDGKFYSPADGTLVSLFPTGHAFCLNTVDGAEVLVHIGIDTVKLKGEFFNTIATQGATVKKGDLIVEVDLDGVKNAGYEIITPIVVANYGKFSKLDRNTGSVNSGDAAITDSRVRSFLTGLLSLVEKDVLPSLQQSHPYSQALYCTLYGLSSTAYS